MNPIPLHFVWQYTDVDRAYWAEHFEEWLPRNILDAHTHVMDPRFRMTPMTEAMRRQYWVNEVLEPIDAPTAQRCMQTVFPNREVSAVVFGLPDLDFDLDAGNQSLQAECPQRAWHSLAVVRPHWPIGKVAALLDAPGVIGVKPYYSLISRNADTRDAHLEASIYDFLPHAQLELLNDRKAWVTLHVPKAARLGHPDNLREIREIRCRYPHIVLVIAHLGRCYTEAHALEALPQLAGDPGLFFDTSAVLNPICHQIAIKHLGASQILYGSDNPILYMRGRRQFEGRSYINRTNYPFYFNKVREAQEIEARYTLYMYEDIAAIKQACNNLGLADKTTIESIFHDNAWRLIQSIVGHKH